MENKFALAWKIAESEGPRPTRVRNIVHRYYPFFSKMIWHQDDKFVKQTVDALMAGDVIILRNGFSKYFMDETQRKCMLYYQSKPSEFYKMLEGTPDFHRLIDFETGKNYSFPVCKHSCFFYPWNDDPLQLWETVYARWRDMKMLMGLDPWAYKNNTPKDGVIDRIQVAQYPSKIGYLAPHSDPYLHQRLFFSGYMSQRGVDYQGGGFYLVGEGDQIVDAEKDIKVGDIGIGCATIVHGVAPCNRDREPDWSSDAGRWFLSMYSNASDEIPNRHTGHPVSLKLEGVLP